jgi:hypothetical protein
MHTAKPLIDSHQNLNQLKVDESWLGFTMPVFYKVGIENRVPVRWLSL